MREILQIYAHNYILPEFTDIYIIKVHDNMNQYFINTL